MKNSMSNAYKKSVLADVNLIKLLLCLSDQCLQASFCSDYPISIVCRNFQQYP